MLDIVNEYPPNIEKIKKVFPECEEMGAIFCYGNKIYNPKGIDIPEDIIFHEYTHSIQQGKNPEAWWKMYLHSKDFRLNQEIQAYAAQYNFIRKHIKDREVVYRSLLESAKQLASPLYGNLLKPTEAKNAIKAYADQLIKSEAIKKIINEPYASR
jgi:hypothetical protein